MANDKSTLAKLLSIPLFDMGISTNQSNYYRQRFNYQDLETAKSILKQYGKDPEDYFKLWPRDKQYFFTQDNTAAIAFRVERKVALIVGDPFGDEQQFKVLFSDFLDHCDLQGWLPAIIHASEKYMSLYTSLEMRRQKIGENAMINLKSFRHGRRRKYFRNIENRFKRLGYTIEILREPLDEMTKKRLKYISDEWLTTRHKRTERGFMMGYFDPEYLDNCLLLVARNADGIIDGFINIIPTFDNDTLNYDLLRTCTQTPSNLSDYLMLELIRYANSHNYSYVDLGLCPLARVDHTSSNHSRIVTKLLQLLHIHGDRFYSFSGILQFKSKYGPAWSNKYIVYRGSNVQFFKIVLALMAAMHTTN